MRDVELAVVCGVVDAVVAVVEYLNLGVDFDFAAPRLFLNLTYFFFENLRIKSKLNAKTFITAWGSR